MSRSRLEIEAGTALSIAIAMEQDLDELERWWPVPRGSNAQRWLDSIKERRETIVQCLRDGGAE